MESLARIDQLQVSQVLRVFTVDSPDLDQGSIQSFLPVSGTTATLAQANPMHGQMILAQHFDEDILGDLSNAWHIFIDSGQVWALLIGIVIGYLIRNLTAY